MFIKKLVSYLLDPKKCVQYMQYRRLHSSYGKNLPDEEYLKEIFKLKMGYELDLEHPKTYNEKLQWLKLYNRKPEYTRMVDKYEAKLYVAEKVGDRYIIPTIGTWDKFEDIEFDSLPNKFVLKTTHDSGGVVIVKDKTKFDIEEAKDKLGKSLERNYFWSNREWPYKNVKPRIIAEQFLEDMDELVEYKMFCFNGEVKMILVCKGQAHGAGRTNDYCDLNLRRLPFTSLNPNSKGELPIPKEMPEILEIARKLSAGIPQLRVDTYVADGKIYFGELTFFHNSGMAFFDPPQWDEIIGEWITLPEKTEE